MNDDVKMIQRLQFQKGKLDIVIDSDAYNEVDDQFAIVYALRASGRFCTKAVYACPFYKPEYNKRSTSPEDGMEKSYNEIISLLNLMDIRPEGFVYRGARRFLDHTRNAVESEAALHLVELARQYSSKNPLTVVAIGALTNVASAILLEPSICERIHVCWLGGPVHSWRNASEFNLHQDITASKVVFESEAALTQVPCFGVASHLLTNAYELEACLDTSILVNKRLVDTFRGYTEDHFAYSKEIWDIAPLAVLMNEDKFCSFVINRRPVITSDETYSVNYDGKFMKVVESLNRNEIFRDLYTKLNCKATGEPGRGKGGKS